MKFLVCRTTTHLIILFLAALSAHAAPRIVFVEKIWDQGNHNASHEGKTSIYLANIALD